MKRWTVVLAGMVALALLADLLTAQPPGPGELVLSREEPLTIQEYHETEKFVLRTFFVRVSLDFS